MKDVQCYELFGGIALKNHAFSFHLYVPYMVVKISHPPLTGVLLSVSSTHQQYSSVTELTEAIVIKFLAHDHNTRLTIEL